MFKLLRIAGIVIIVVISSGGAIRAAEYWVHPDGSDSNPGTQESPFRTIKHAVDQCTDNADDVIHVQDDPTEPTDYVEEPIWLKSKLQIIFEENVEVKAASGFGTTACLFRATSKSNITLNGYGATLQMRKSEYTGGSRHVIRLDGCRPPL